MTHLSSFFIFNVVKDAKWKRQRVELRGDLERLESAGNDGGWKGEAGGECRDSKSRFEVKKKKRDIEELWKTEPVWQHSCVDCGWTGSLSCGFEMGPDRVISHVEIYPGFFQEWEDETERPFPLVMNIYLVRVFTGCCIE